MKPITTCVLEIYNLYSKMFKTAKYVRYFTNVPVERLTYYKDLHEMFISVAFKEGIAAGTYTAMVPETLMKVVVSHASKGRRIAFFTDKRHVMGHVFFGLESDLEIKAQVDSGYRPANWGNPNHKEWSEWKDTQLKFRKSDIGTGYWGHADILQGVTPVLGFKATEV